MTSTHSRSAAKESSCSRRSQMLQLKFSSHVLCGSRLMSVWCCAGTWLTGHPEWNLSIDCYNWCWLFVTVMFMTINIFWCDAMMCCYDSSLLLIKSMLMSTDDMSWWVFVIDAPTHNTYVQQIKTTTHWNFNSTISNITQCYASSISDSLPVLGECGNINDDDWISARISLKVERWCKTSKYMLTT